MLVPEVQVSAFGTAGVLMATKTRKGCWSRGEPAFWGIRLKNLTCKVYSLSLSSSCTTPKTHFFSLFFLLIFLVSGTTYKRTVFTCRKLHYWRLFFWSATFSPNSQVTPVFILHEFIKFFLNNYLPNQSYVLCGGVIGAIGMLGGKGKRGGCRISVTTWHASFEEISISTN